MAEYLLTGMEFAWNDYVSRSLLILIVSVCTVLFLRRVYAVHRSGGAFWASYHIARGNFYIHSALFFGKRVIPMNTIQSIRFIGYFGRRMGSGLRYTMYIERKRGKTMTVFFGKSKRIDKLMERLKKETKSYGIRVTTYRRPL